MLLILFFVVDFVNGFYVDVNDFVDEIFYAKSVDFILLLILILLILLMLRRSAMLLIVMRL